MVPVWANDGTVIMGVLDVDSDIKAAFTEEDRDGLEDVCKLLGNLSLDPFLRVIDNIDDDVNDD